MKVLPYGRQLIEDDDVEAVVQALRSGVIAHGPCAKAFEQAFAAKLGAAQGVVCASGTAALHLALAGLGIGPGDLCVVPAITFLSTATAALLCGAEVVFADVDPFTGLMTPETLAAAMNHRSVKAVLPVHLGGRLCDVAAISALARAKNAVIVEDACHAVGGVDEAGAAIGACLQSDAACFSFHPVKTLAAGEGGMVTLNDALRADRLRRLRNHGVTHDTEQLTETDSLDLTGARKPWIYEQHELGFNYRIDEMSAALGKSQLGKLNRFVERRTHLADLYDGALGALNPALRLIPRGQGRPALHLYQVLIDFEAAGLAREAVMHELMAAGVSTQVHYIPLYRQPFFKARCTVRRLDGAEAFYARVLALPLFPAMADEDVTLVANALEKALT